MMIDPARNTPCGNLPWGRGARRLAVAAVVALWAPAAMAAETLADALAGAYNTSGLLEQNRALLRAADEDVAGTIARLRPVIGWTTNVTHNYANNYGSGIPAGTARSSGATSLNASLTAQWLLYDFGRTQLATESAKEIVLATRESLVSIEQQVLLRAVQAYMNVQSSTRFVALARSDVRVTGESLRAARDRFEVGEVTRTDVAQAEAALALARSSLTNAQGVLERAAAEYVAVVGHAPGNLIRTPSLPRLTRTEDTAKQVALRSHPDMLSAQHNVAAANLNVDVAEAAMRPQLSLNANVGVTDQLNGSIHGDSGSIGIQIGGPIYQGGALASAKRRAFAQRDAQLGVLHQTRDQVRQNVSNAYATLKATRATLKSNGDQIRAARVAYEGVKEEAKLGARTTLDVLNAEQDYLDAQARQIASQADLYIATYAVLASMGELTVRDLNLAVQTYDPSAYYNLVKDAPAALSPRGRSLDRVLRKLGK